MFIIVRVEFPLQNETKSYNVRYKIEISAQKTIQAGEKQTLT